MRGGWRAGLAVAAALFQAPAATAASFDCSVRGLSASETTICRDPQLSRTDEQMARRLAGFVNRLNYGQYVGLRLWQSSQARSRHGCGADAACIAANYRTQMRFLDRLQLCLEISAQRRACLRNTLIGTDAFGPRPGGFAPHPRSVY